MSDFQKKEAFQANCQTFKENLTKDLDGISNWRTCGAVEFIKSNIYALKKNGPRLRATMSANP